MTNEEIIQAIKEEIERRLKDYWKICFHDVKTYNEDSNVRELKELLSFLSTLESERPMNQDESLNEEIKKEMANLPFVIRGKDQIAFARHFAQWGAEHLKKKEMNEMKDAMEAHYPEKYEKILLSLHHVMNCADAQNAVKRDGLELEDVCDFLFSLKLNRKLDKKIPYQKELEEYAITGGFAYVDNIIDKGHTNKWCADDVEQAYHDGIIVGSEWQKEQMLKEAVKWLVDDDYDELADKGRFILGSAGIGYNGYYIPYSDLLKLPKED